MTQQEKFDLAAAVSGIIMSQDEQPDRHVPNAAARIATLEREIGTMNEALNAKDRNILDLATSVREKQAAIKGLMEQNTELREGIELAWGVIANAAGFDEQHLNWWQAANRWRDRFVGKLPQAAQADAHHQAEMSGTKPPIVGSGPAAAKALWPIQQAQAMLEDNYPAWNEAGRAHAISSACGYLRDAHSQITLLVATAAAPAHATNNHNHETPSNPRHQRNL